MKRITTLACAALLGACSSSESAVRREVMDDAVSPQSTVAAERSQETPRVDAVVAEPVVPAMPMVEPAAIEPVTVEPSTPGPATEVAVGAEGVEVAEPAVPPSAVVVMPQPVEAAELSQVRTAMLAAIREDRLDRAAALHAQLAGRMGFAADDPRAELAADVDALAGFVAAMQARSSSASRD